MGSSPWLGHFRKAFDLTHSLHPGVPTWGGGCGFEPKVQLDYPEGLRVQSLRSHAGVGTHLDAPSHFISGGQGVGEIELERLLVPLCVVDVSSKREEDLWVTRRDLEQDEERYGAIGKGSLCIFATGWEEFWDTPEAYRNQKEDGKMHFPGLAEETTPFLVDREVSGVGIDTLSPDGSRQGKGAHHFPIHLTLLGQGIYILENLCSLRFLPPRGGYALVLPLKAPALTEGGCRVVALYA